MGYKYVKLNPNLEVNTMKRKRLLTVLAALAFLLVSGFSIQAQNSPRTLTLLYSNNIGAEIESCPT